MNMNLRHFSALVSGSCSSSRCDPASLLLPGALLCPVSPLEGPQWPLVSKPACAEEAAHIKGAGPCVVAETLVYPDLRYKASISRHQNTRRHGMRRLPPSFGPSHRRVFLIHRRFVFGELFLPSQLLLLLINLNHPHGDEGNSQMSTNIGRLDWMY